MIGLAKHYGDLYVFHAQHLFFNIFPTFSTNIVSSLENNVILWHHMLRQISDSIYKCIAT